MEDAQIHAEHLAMIGSLVHKNKTFLKANDQGENLGSRCSNKPVKNKDEVQRSIRKIVKKW